MAKQWARFPHPTSQFDYDPKQLKRHWSRLHESDREPYPDDGDLILAWRHYHAGEFQAASELGDQIGPSGAYVASRAAGIYATYLEPNDKRKLALFEECVERAEAALEARPDHASLHYIHAFALGRHGQGISVAKALALGHAGKIKRSLGSCLELEPKHADALVALGVYHAEIVDKVGAVVAKLTYGATAKAAHKHLAQAVKLAPNMPIAKIEYANALLMLDGVDGEEQATELYNEAAEMEPTDAMECLDIELAKSELE